MPNYTIEAHGDVLELYNVEAQDVEDAIRKWENADVGEPYLSEIIGTSIYRVTRDED